MIQTAQITNDRRQRRRHDRLIQRRQEHPQHQPAEHHQDLPMGQLRTTRGSRNTHVRPPRSNTSFANRSSNGANTARSPSDQPANNSVKYRCRASRNNRNTSTPAGVKPTRAARPSNGSSARTTSPPPSNVFTCRLIVDVSTPRNCANSETRTSPRSETHLNTPNPARSTDTPAAPMKRSCVEAKENSRTIVTTASSIATTESTVR